MQSFFPTLIQSRNICDIKNVTMQKEKNYLANEELQILLRINFVNLSFTAFSRNELLLLGKYSKMRGSHQPPNSCQAASVAC